MDFVDLGGGYLLAGFGNFESALTATEKFYGTGFKVEYLNEASYIKDSEIKEYTRCVSRSERAKELSKTKSWIDYGKEEANAKEKLAMAISELEEKTKQKARFILILNSKR